MTFNYPFKPNALNTPRSYVVHDSFVNICHHMHDKLLHILCYILSAMLGVQVLFWDADAGEVCTGLVCTNDPHLRQLSVKVLAGPEAESAERFVSYDLLRSLDASYSANTAAEEDDEEGEEEGSTGPPAPKKCKTPRKEPAVEVDMATLIECGEEETVALTYVPCVNGILKTGSVALYGAQEFRVDSLVYDGRRKKAFAMLVSTKDEVCIIVFISNNMQAFCGTSIIIADKHTNDCYKIHEFLQYSYQCLLQDETARVPAVKVRLLQEDYLKKETVDFLQLENPHPVNVAFVAFSATKRLVGQARGNSSKSWTFGPATPLLRRFTGFTKSNGREIVKFCAQRPDGTAGCPRSWDSILGDRWDILPSTGSRQDVGIRSLRFTEHREFGLFSIRCHVTSCEGHYRNQPDYRALIIHNLNEARKADTYLG